jgi:hypothetical protein
MAAPAEHAFLNVEGHGWIPAQYVPARPTRAAEPTAESGAAIALLLRQAGNSPQFLRGLPRVPQLRTLLMGLAYGLLGVSAYREPQAQTLDAAAPMGRRDDGARLRRVSRRDARRASRTATTGEERARRARQCRRAYGTHVGRRVSFAARADLYSLLCGLTGTCWARRSA